MCLICVKLLIYFDNFGKNKLFSWISISPVAMFSNPASRLPTKVSKTQSGSLIILIKMGPHGLHWINYRIHWVAFFNLRHSSFIHLFNEFLSLHSKHTKMLNITCTMWYTSFVSYPISPTGNVFTLFVWQKKILIHTKMKFTHFAPWESILEYFIWENKSFLPLCFRNNLFRPSLKYIFHYN